MFILFLRILYTTVRLLVSFFNFLNNIIIISLFILFFNNINLIDINYYIYMKSNTIVRLSDQIIVHFQLFSITFLLLFIVYFDSTTNNNYYYYYYYFLFNF